MISTLSVGGAEMLLARLVPRVAARGHRNIVLVLGSDLTLKPTLEAGGAYVVALGLSPEEMPAPRSIARLRAVVRQWDVDVIHGWMAHGCIAALLIRFLLPRRCVMIWATHQTLYDLRAEKPLTRMLIWLMARLSGLPDALVFVSKVSRDQHQAIGVRNRVTVIIPNGIDPTQFGFGADSRAKSRAKLHVPGDVPLVGHVGRFHPMKDYETLVRCAHRVLAEFADARFVLIGRDVTSENARLRELVASGSGRDRIILLGQRDDVHELLPGLDVFCLSSAWGEAFPTVLLEAMSCGVPCAVTDIGDSAVLVGSTGRVVRPGDPRSLADAVCSLLRRDPAVVQLDARQARARIVDHYDIDAIAARYLTLYEQTPVFTDHERSSVVSGEEG